MNIEKQVTVMTDISQREEKSAKVFSADMTLEQLYSCFPDFKNGNLHTVFNDKRIKHVVVCLYENHAGREKRRIGGFMDKTTGKDELMGIVKNVAHSLGIGITRSLEILQP